MRDSRLTFSKYLIITDVKSNLSDIFDTPKKSYDKSYIKISRINKQKLEIKPRKNYKYIVKL